MNLEAVPTCSNPLCVHADEVHHILRQGCRSNPAWRDGRSTWRPLSDAVGDFIGLRARLVGSMGLTVCSASRTFVTATVDAGSAGKRVELSTTHQVAWDAGRSTACLRPPSHAFARLRTHLVWQLWGKPLGGGRVAALVLSNASTPITVRVELGKLDPALNATGHEVVTARDLYDHRELGEVTGGVWTAAELAPHDSRMVAFSLK